METNLFRNIELKAISIVQVQCKVHYNRYKLHKLPYAGAVSCRAVCFHTHKHTHTHALSTHVCKWAIAFDV